MIARETSANHRGRTRRPRISRETSVYLVREAAELTLLVAVLAIVGSFADVPTWVLVGLPLAKAFTSVVFYVMFLRRVFRRPARAGTEDLIGKAAKAAAPLCPTGQVKVAGEIWSARSADGSTIARHANVKIVGSRGNTVLVARSTLEV